MYSKDTLVVGVARAGQPDQKWVHALTCVLCVARCALSLVCAVVWWFRVISGTMEELLKVDFGGPLHSLVIPGECHFIETEMLEFYHWNRAARAKAKAEAEAKAAALSAAEDAKRKAEQKQAPSQPTKLGPAIIPTRPKPTPKPAASATAAAAAPAPPSNSNEPDVGEVPSLF